MRLVPTAGRGLKRGRSSLSNSPSSSHDEAGVEHHHHSMAFLSTSSPLKLALIVLNAELRCEMAGDLFTHLWGQASVKVCADGAANRLHDSTPAERRGSLLPDVICGDLDSLREDVSRFYATQGVSILREPEQDSHDFEKCLRWLQRQHEALAQSEASASEGTSAAESSSAATDHADRPFAVAAYGVRSAGRAHIPHLVPFHAPFTAVRGERRPTAAHPIPPKNARARALVSQAFGGRLDQQMANLNMLFRSEYTCFEQFVLLSDDSLALLLLPGAHTIEPNLEVEDGTCGLVPLGGRCENVVTTGLKWNLDGTMPLEFGALVSSSNQIVGQTVTVQTERPLLWTTSLRKVRREAQGSS